MKKVCIVTNYHDTRNYGALLQAFALNKYINSLDNCVCKTLNYSVEKSNVSKFSKYWERLIKFQISSMVLDFNRDIRKLIVRKKILERKNALNVFRNSIPHTEIYNTQNTHKLEERFDILICGSDQIWKPDDQGNLVGIYWLTDIGNSVVKASYAASIGLSKYDDCNIQEVKKNLLKFDIITVREQASADYLSSLIGKEVKAVIDPVFLLEKRMWDRLIQPFDMHEDYIFVYLIHGSKKTLKNITQFAREKKCKIVAFPYMASYYRTQERMFGDYRYYNVTPEGFLGLIKNAKYVITDSFHCTAFSILFHKHFYAIAASADSVSSTNNLLRINNLLQKIGLYESCKPVEDFDMENSENEKQINWKNVDMKIQNERNYGKEIINQILNIRRKD